MRQPSNTINGNKTGHLGTMRGELWGFTDAA
jgi:hypothetical protein